MRGGRIFHLPKRASGAGLSGDHADLTGVLADQHHPQAHDLASHSTKPHSALSGVGVDDHHNEAHTLTSHSSKAHSELSGVGADDHHAQAHTLTSHSSRAHSELSGVGADDHHAQAHTLTSHSSRAHSELSGIGANDHHNQSHPDSDHSDGPNLTGDVTTAARVATIGANKVTGPMLSVVPSVRPNVNSLLAWTEDPAFVGQARTPAAATIYLRKIMVPSAISIANLLVSQSTAGTSYTNAQLAVYSSAGTLLGASAVQASAGTNGFGATAPNIVTLPLTVIGGQSLTVTGGEGVFVWAALHMGTNSATAAIFQGPGGTFTTMNAGLGVSTARAGTYAGHATNSLATIGNLTPASIVNNTSTSLIWFGIT